jgi:ADP-heptose:LPS heptosyltransferase
LVTPVCPDQKLRFEEFLKDEGALNPTENDRPMDFRKLALPFWASMRVEPPQGLKSPLPSAGSSPRAFLFPGSVWATKRWSEEGFIDVARRLQGDGYEIHWMGSNGEAELCERLRGQVPGTFSHAGRLSLTESFLALSGGRLLISNDSGSMHLGSMAGIPTVAVFGPTVLEIGYRPWQQQAIVVQKALSCRPCGKHGHDRCPLGHHRCMLTITGEEVFTNARALTLPENL